VIAGLAAEGRTEVSGVDHIDRGYENIVEKLASLGGSVVRSAVAPEAAMKLA
jgi:UDP-N-acetylglucosamine 1-carboxyvinyltransferase